MFPLIEFPLFLILIILAITALHTKDLLFAAILSSGCSFVTALIYLSMGAVDVGFTEAVVGGGVSGILMILLIFKTQRRSQD